MRCDHCGLRAVEVQMSWRDGHRITMRACCKPEWFCDGERVRFADIASLLPARSNRGRKPKQLATAAPQFAAAQAA